MDISDPDSTHLVSVVLHPGYGVNVALNGNYAYVAADYFGGLFVIDITNPADMVLECTCWTDNTYGVFVGDGYAYVVVQGSLRVMDLVNPADPVLVGSCNGQSFCRNLTVRNNLAYVVGNGLEIFDVSDPTAPTSIGYSPLPGFSRDIVLWSEYAYIASDTAGLRVFDISDPGAPVEVGYYNTPGKAWGLTCDQNIIYLADSSRFGVYEFTPTTDSIALRPDSLDFGEVPVDSSAVRVFWIVNCGTDTLFVDSMRSDNPVFVDVTNYEAVVPPDDSVLCGIAFQPLAEQEYVGHFTVYSNAGNPAVLMIGTGIIIDVSPSPTSLPTDFALLPAFPNPFNGSTTINFALPRAEDVIIRAYDVLGREVAIIADREFGSGWHQVPWNCESCASGLYMIVMTASGNRFSQKAVLLR